MDMSLEWFKNFGFKEFYKALLKRKISKGCEES
jgi:N-acetylglutamate synthase-like GNAT family acetyltransferase